MKDKDKEIIKTLEKQVEKLKDVNDKNEKLREEVKKYKDRSIAEKKAKEEGENRIKELEY